MRASRGMGDITPSKMPGAKKKARRDDTDFTEYKKGGKVKKFEKGGDVEITPNGLRLKKDKVSLQDASHVAMSKDSSGRPTYGAKTPIGTAAAQKSYDKNWMKKESADETFARTIQARDEADDEAQRESTRGIKPENRKAKGGKVGKGPKSIITTKGGTASAMAKKLLDKPGSLKASDMYAKGGKTKSKVNAAGNYTKPEMRKRIVSQVKAAATQGTGAGQWSARKAQLVAKKYKAAGGGYK